MDLLRIGIKPWFRGVRPPEIGDPEVSKSRPTQDLEILGIGMVGFRPLKSTILGCRNHPFLDTFGDQIGVGRLSQIPETPVHVKRA